MTHDYPEMLRQIQEAVANAAKDKPPPGASNEEMWAWKSRAATAVKPLLDAMWNALESDGGTNREDPIYLEAKRNHAEVSRLLLQYLAH